MPYDKKFIHHCFFAQMLSQVALRIYYFEISWGSFIVSILYLLVLNYSHSICTILSSHIQEHSKYTVIISQNTAHYHHSNPPPFYFIERHPMSYRINMLMIFSNFQKQTPAIVQSQAHFRVICQKCVLLETAKCISV